MHSTKVPALRPPARESELEDPESAVEAPVMDQDDLISKNSDHEDSDDDEFNDSMVQEIVNDWTVSLRLEQCRMLAKILIELFKTRQGMTVKSAAIER